MSTENREVTQRERNRSKIIGLIPKEHRLPGLLFLIIEGFFGSLAYTSSDNVKLATIVGMVIVACVFLFRFFSSKSVRHQGVPSQDAQNGGFPVVNAYSNLQDDPCPLFKKAAEDKYNEANAFFLDLLHDRIEIYSMEKVAEILEFLFCEVTEIKKIYAVSHGEFDEWRDTGWWMRNYLRIHDLAVERGVEIKRIFILETEKQIKSEEDIFDKNKQQGVEILTALKQRISVQDLHEAGNCLIFCKSSNEPIYSLQAKHSGDGGLEKITIFRDYQHITQLVEAFKRIEANANSFHLADEK